MKSRLTLLAIVILIISATGTVSATSAQSHASQSRSLFLQTHEEVLAYPAVCDQRPLAQKIKHPAPRCGDSLAVWKVYAGYLLGEHKRTRIYDDPVASELLKIVRRNAVITAAYAHLYLLSRDSFPACGRSLLPWVGGASLGSLRSGQVMRSALSSQVGGIAEYEKAQDADFARKFEESLGSLIAPQALREAALVLGIGNHDIFMDLFWQLHAGALCGPEVVIATIEAEPQSESDPRLARALKSWRLIAEALTDCDPQKVLEANHGFVEVEQYLVAQSVMYDGWMQFLGGKMLAPLVEPAVPLVLGTFPDFIDHARQTVPEYRINFADADLRVSWMKDQLTLMEREFRAQPFILGPLFCGPPTTDSELL